MPKNETRVASDHGLLLSEARLNRIIKLDVARFAKKPNWVLTDDEWKTHSEFEAIFHVTSIASTQTQYEKLFTGAYTPCIKAMAVAKLRKIHLPVIDYDAMTGDTKFARPNKNVESFTPTGRQALERTRLEAER